MARAVLGVWLVLAAVALSPHPTRAAGAIAIGLPADVSVNGVALGSGFNYPTTEEAAARALEECRTAEATKTAQSLCKVFKTFSHQCFAFALDPQPGTPGVGWGTGTDQATADNEAMTVCHATAGPSRIAFCEVMRRGCDTGSGK